MMTTPAPPTGPAAPEPTAPAATTETVQAPTSGDEGFPASTPLEQMNDAQKAAYWQHYARKHENTVKAFNGLTPQQIKDLQAENDALKTEKLSADDKAIKVARDEAAKAAAEVAKAEYLPQIQQLKVQAIAADVIKGEQLKAFMAIANPAAFLDDNGEVDETKVMGHLTAMYGTTQSASSTPGQRWQNAGQGAQPPSRGNGAADEVARQMKRLGIKPTT